MASRKSKIDTKHLECPVCLNVYDDPRMLPCAHTICAHCVDKLVHDSSIACPMCRATHAVPATNSDGFPRNLALAGMIDSCCRQCMSTEPEAQCSHCQKMLCFDCQQSHLGFQGAKQSFEKISIALQKAGVAMKDTAIEHMGSLIETEINKVAAYLIQQVRDRSKALTNDVKKVIETSVASRDAWKEDMKTTMATAQSFLDDMSSLLGDVYGNHLSDQEISNISKQSKQQIQDIELALTKVPPLSRPYVQYNTAEVVSAIRTFGEIKLHPAGADDCPVAVDTCTTRPERPTVIGKYGSGHGEFKTPHDVAVCRVTGRVVVTDPGNHRLQVLDNKLKHVTNITRDGQGRDLQYPAGVAINSKAEIIMSDYSANSVLVYSTSGRYSRHLAGPWGHPWDITVDGDDNVYVCDTASYSIRVSDKAGNVIRTFGGKGSGPGELIHKPLFIALHDNTLIVSDVTGRLYKFIKTGSYLKQLNVVRDASGITVDTSGDLVIVDYEGSINTIRDDKVIRRIGECGRETWQLDNPQGVAVMNSGQIIVANWGKHNALVYDVMKKIYAN